MVVEAVRRATRKRRRLAKPEAAMVTLWRKAWRVERRRLLAALRPVRAYLTEADRPTRAEIERLLREAIGVGDRATISRMQHLLDDAILMGGSDGRADLIHPPDGVGAFDLRNPRAKAVAANRAATMVRNVSDSTRETLRGIIVDAVDAGTSWTTVEETIIARYRSWGAKHPEARSRAKLIATTEIGQAYEDGRKASLDSLLSDYPNIIMEKRWLTVGDDRVSKEICRPNGDRGWITYGADFPSGHNHPLGHPGCRCDLLTRDRVDS